MKTIDEVSISIIFALLGFIFGMYIFSFRATDSIIFAIICYWASDLSFLLKENPK
jgi:hypothetical protein